MPFTALVISTKDWGAIPAGPFEQTVPKYSGSRLDATQLANPPIPPELGGGAVRRGVGLIALI